VNRTNNLDVLLWGRFGRWLCFLLASTSIACLLLEFYGICPMRTGVLFIFLPASVCLFLLALFDKRHGDAHLCKAVVMGCIAGLIAAVAYDVFRLPFVFAKEWHVTGIFPPLSLFKVFPRFGAMILGELTEQTTYSTLAQILGWTYHFSNGAAFGIMYLALICDPRQRSWWWGIVFATGIEIAMLLTPYTSAFAIRTTSAFIVATLSAHVIFGCALGKAAQHLAGVRCGKKSCS